MATAIGGSGTDSAASGVRLSPQRLCSLNFEWPVVHADHATTWRRLKRFSCLHDPSGSEVQLHSESTAQSSRDPFFHIHLATSVHPPDDSDEVFHMQLFDFKLTLQLTS